MTTTAKGAALVTGASSGIGTISAKGVRPQGWTTAFAEQSEKSFADMLAEDVMLEASTLARPIVGRNHVKHVMGVASKIYEALAFTHQVESGARTYLEWQAKAFGGESFAGVTVLTKDERGLGLAPCLASKSAPKRNPAESERKPSIYQRYFQRAGVPIGAGWDPTKLSFYGPYITSSGYVPAPGSRTRTSQMVLP